MACFSQRLLLLAALLSTVSAWIAVGPVTKGTLDVFQMTDQGQKVKELVSFPVTAGETMAPNSFACGRCFCLALTSHAAIKTSYLCE